jgi:hypothetical protein
VLLKSGILVVVGVIMSAAIGAAAKAKLAASKKIV